MITLGLAFLAGVFSILSPCVLPMLPIALGAAVSEHKLGPVSLAAGLGLSFVAIGLFVATIGYSIGLDLAVFRSLAAMLLILFGAILILPPLQARLATATGPVSNWTERRFGGTARTGLWGQFAVGVLLGAAWTPCVGPTLGAASVLAAQGQDLGQVVLTMASFGLGTAVPLIAFGLLSREALLRWRGRMLLAGQRGKALLGAVLLLGGMIILSGADRALEAALFRVAPDWVLDLTTRF
jgi:cytochrome c-type biogenesis protein